MQSIGTVIAGAWCHYDDFRSKNTPIRLMLDHLQRSGVVIKKGKELLLMHPFATGRYLRPSEFTDHLTEFLDFTGVTDTLPPVTRKANPYNRTEFKKTYRQGFTKSIE